MADVRENKDERRITRDCEFRAGLLDMLGNDEPENRDKLLSLPIEEYTTQVGLSGILCGSWLTAGTQVGVEKELLMT